MNQKGNHTKQFKAHQEKNYGKMLVSSGFTSVYLQKDPIIKFFSSQ